MTTFTKIGKRINRVDGPAKVTGEQMYVADVKVPRLLHAKVLRSPYAHARILRIDTSRAKAYSGVARVFIAQDIPDLLEDPPTRAQNMLAQREVFFSGQPIAVVLAEDPSVAEEAVDLIEVTYEELPVVVDIEEALKDGAPLARTPLRAVDRSEEAAHSVTFKNLRGDPIEVDPNSNISQRFNFSRGDVAKAFAESDVVIERKYKTSWIHQGYMETQSCIVAYDVTGQFTVWASTQGQHNLRKQLAEILHVPEAKINVIGMEFGGGFGGKIAPLTDALAAVLAREVRRPVKLIMSRSEDLKAGNPSFGAVYYVKTGARRDGSLTALEVKAIVDTGCYPGAGAMGGSNLMALNYYWPNQRIEGYEVMTNKPNNGALRGPGCPESSFVIDSQMELMAHELGLDPLEFRLKNAAQGGEPLMSDEPLPSVSLRECLRRLGETDLWKNRHNKGSNQGVGIAVGGWLGARMPSTVILTLNSDGSFSLITGTNDMTGVFTAARQIAAEELGCSLERIQVKWGDTNTTPYTAISGGSKAFRAMGLAVLAAAKDARRQMFSLAAERLECSPDDLEAADDAIRVKGSPEKHVTFETLSSITTGLGSQRPPIVARGDSGEVPFIPIFNCQGAKVEVDPETGAVTILESVCIQDIGFAVNPTLVEQQIQGGVAQSLAIGFSEEMMWNEKGILLNPTLLDYRVPTALDLPMIQVELPEIPTDEPPYGGRGVGEPPIAAGTGALANAIYDAVGARVYQLPITSERILRALGKLP